MQLRDIDDLVGQECDQVWFVRDYVQVWFSDAGLTCIAPPVVVRDGVAVRFPEAGSRDALCSLIDATVVSATCNNEDEIEVRFSDGASLRLEIDRERPEWEIWDLVKRTW